MTIPVSVSEPHSIANIRKTHPEIIAEVGAIVKLRNERFLDIKVETSLSTAFGCTMQGEVPEDDVVRIASQLAEFCDKLPNGSSVNKKQPVNPPPVGSWFHVIFDNDGTNATLAIDGAATTLGGLAQPSGPKLSWPPSWFQ